jgi:hypothetical protein
MKKLLLAAVLVAGGCSLALAQGTGTGPGSGAGPSATPGMTQDPKQGTMRDDNPAKKVAKKAKAKKKKAKK